MDTRQFATIELDEWEGYNAVVFDTDRLVYVQPQDTIERGFFLTQQEAIACLRRYYPDIPLIEGEEQFTAAYEQQGYHYPGQYSLRTDFLCHYCHHELRMDRRSLGVGRKAPWGALQTHFYTCTGCDTYYSCQSQNRQRGISREWNNRLPGEERFLECDPPHMLPCQNPYKFYEIRLVSHAIFVALQNEEEGAHP